VKEAIFVHEDVISISGLRKEVELGGNLLPILKGIDLQVRKGEFLAIMGPSGSGKSTLLGLMAGLDTATTGSIKVAGTEIVGLGEDDLARLRARYIGIIFQAFHLIPTLSAIENVALPLELAGKGTKATTRAEAMLRAVGLGDRLKHYPRHMSGGEQQRVAIARAFAPGPEIIFADEPTGNLDSANGKAVMELMLERCHNESTTLVMVTHDPDLGALADRTIYLQDGALMREEVRSHGRMAR
jgi:putative ABC transport system ATP-binding protein